MTSIGILPVDSDHPDYALMKVSAFFKAQGAIVGMYNPFSRYDLVYASKIFTFTPDYPYVIANADEVRKGGTGYDIASRLPQAIDDTAPDYSIYGLPDNYALGFLTRGCPNKCAWCVVPKKEGGVTPYRDIEEIAVNGRDHVTLMDNNVLASDYGLGQIDKIAKLRLRVDFNQGLDARRIDAEVAKLLSRCRWQRFIRLACDTSAQIGSVKDAVCRLRKAGYHGQVFVYCLINNDINESLQRITEIGNIDENISPFAQPYRDFSGKAQPPQWQRDLARWVNRKELFRSCSFRDFQPRQGFKCEQYLSQ